MNFRLLLCFLAIFTLKINPSCCWLWRKLPVQWTQGVSSKQRTFGSKWLQEAKEKRGFLPRIYQQSVDEDDLLHVQAAALMKVVPKSPKVGDTATGIITRIESHAIFLNIDDGHDGFLPTEETTVSYRSQNLSANYFVGQNLTGRIIGVFNGMKVMSLKWEQIDANWKMLERLMEDNAKFNVTAISVNRGGIICSVLGVDAFLPGSQLLVPLNSTAVGQEFLVQLLGLNRTENKVIVSCRAAMKSHFPVGTLVNGTVKQVYHFGVIVALPGEATALLHASKITRNSSFWKPNMQVADIEKVLKLGDPVVAVVTASTDAQSMQLSTKVLELNAGDMLRDKAAVYQNAEERAEKFRKKLMLERQAQATAGSFNPQGSSSGRGGRPGGGGGAEVRGENSVS